MTLRKWIKKQISYAEYKWQLTMEGTVEADQWEHTLEYLEGQLEWLDRKRGMRK